MPARFFLGVRSNRASQHNVGCSIADHLLPIKGIGRTIKRDGCVQNGRSGAVILDRAGKRDSELVRQ